MILYALGLAIITYGPWIFLAVLLWRSRHNVRAITLIVVAMALLAFATSMKNDLILSWISEASLWFLLLGWLGYARKWLFAALANIIGTALVANFAVSAHRLSSTIGAPSDSNDRGAVLVTAFIALSLSATALGWLLGTFLDRRLDRQST